VGKDVTPEEMLKWVVVGSLVLIVIIAVSQMDRGEPPEEDGPQIIDEDELE